MDYQGQKTITRIERDDFDMQDVLAPPVAPNISHNIINLGSAAGGFGNVPSNASDSFESTANGLGDIVDNSGNTIGASESDFGNFLPDDVVSVNEGVKKIENESASVVNNGQYENHAVNSANLNTFYTGNTISNNTKRQIQNAIGDFKKNKKSPASLMNAVQNMTAANLNHSWGRRYGEDQNNLEKAA